MMRLLPSSPGSPGTAASGFSGSYTYSPCAPRKTKRRCRDIGVVGDDLHQRLTARYPAANSLRTATAVMAPCSRSAAMAALVPRRTAAARIPFPQHPGGPLQGGGIKGHHRRRGQGGQFALRTVPALLGAQDTAVLPSAPPPPAPPAPLSAGPRCRWPPDAAEQQHGGPLRGAVEATSPSIRPRGVIVYADIAGSAVLGHIGLHGHHRHRRPPPSPQPRKHLPVRGISSTPSAPLDTSRSSRSRCSSASFSGSASAPAAPHSGPWPPAPCPAGWPDQVAAFRLPEDHRDLPAPAGTQLSGSVANSINSAQSPRGTTSCQHHLVFHLALPPSGSGGPPLHPAPAGGSAP